MKKYRSHDRIKIISGSLKGMIGHIAGFTSSGRVLILETSRMVRCSGLIRRMGNKTRMAMKSVDVSNICHVDQDGRQSKIAICESGLGRYRFYKTTGKMVNGDCQSRLFWSRRKQLRQDSIKSLNRNEQRS